MVTPRSNTYAVPSGKAVYAGIANPGSPSVTAGEWQTLSVAPYSMRVFTATGGVGFGPEDTANAIAADAVPPTTVTAIPQKAFGPVIRGERGMVYHAGGLHSNWPGNSLHRWTLPKGADTTCEAQENHPGSIPPSGLLSGYGSGKGAYVHKMYGTPLADVSDWQPHPGHTWAHASWHPDWGHIYLTGYAIQNAGSYLTDGNGHPRSSVLGYAPLSIPAETLGVVGYSWVTGKYTTHLSTNLPWPQTLLGATGFSDYNPVDQSIVFVQTNAGQLHIQRHRAVGGRTYLGYTGLVGGFDASQGNGIIVRHLEQQKYLMLRQDSSGAFAARTAAFLFSPQFGTLPANPFSTALTSTHIKALTFPVGPTTGLPDSVDCVQFCVDRNSRRIFWVIFRGLDLPFKFYMSTFEDIMNWTEIETTSSPVVVTAPYAEAVFAGCRQRIHFEDGYLYFFLGEGPNSAGFLDGAFRLLRCKVDAGEDLPAMTFTRYDYRVQGFTFSTDPALQLWGTKHANWAYRSADGAYYLCGGDLGGAFNHSMAKLSFSGTGPGDYLFTELLNETAPAPSGYVRPVSTDDGAWMYCGAGNSNAALADKFIYQRGGQGVGFVSNVYTRAAYASAVPAGAARDAWLAGNGQPEGDAAMQADGWTMAKFVLYDAANNRFTAVDTTTWPLTHGYPVAPIHPALMANDASRCGCFDKSTNQVFRFYSYNGNLSLVRFDFNAQTARIWNISSWFDTANLFGRGAGTRWFLDNVPPPSAGAVIQDFGWYDSGAGRHRAGGPTHWEHKAIWIDERDGKLYCVAPSTGFLWCFETRGTETDFGAGGDGLTIPYYPVGSRIPLKGTYPATGSIDAYPPVLYGTVSPGQPGYTNGDTAMNSFLVPFKGGLLWWSSCHHDGGVSGDPLYAFWRRLGYTGDWTVVSMPQECIANTYGAKSTAYDNDEIMLISTANEYGPYPWFWKLT